MFSWFRLKCASHLSTAPREEKQSYRVWAKVVNVYDGDTITLALICRNKIVRRRCRLVRIDAPEMRGDHKSEAIASRDFLQSILPKKVFRVQVLGLDKYGRLLIDPKTSKGQYVSKIMIVKKHAVFYDGGKKQ